MMDDQASLRALRKHFLDTSTVSMPIAGMIYWGVVAIAGLVLAPSAVAYVVLFGSGMIFPLAALIDRARGRRITAGGPGEPLTRMFLSTIAMAVMLWPLVIIGARAAGDTDLIVLGGAVLMGIIWIPYGWAADDPAGMQHAVLRLAGCYAAYLLAPEPLRATAIALVVLASYLFSLIRMRRPAAAPAV